MNTTLFTLLFTMLLSSLGTSIINIALPALMSGFGTDLYTAQWASVAYLISTTVFTLLVGKLSARKNLRILFQMGLLLFATSSFAASFSNSIYQIIFLRVIQGIGAAALISLSPVFLSRVADQKQLPFYMGLIGTMSAVGTALGPGLGGFLIEHANWPALFWFMSFLAVIAFILFRKIKPEWIEVPHNSIDDTENAKANYSSLLKKDFILSQLILNFLISMIVVSTLIVGPFFLSRYLDLNFSKVGMVMSISPLISIISGFFSGQIVKYLGFRKTTAISLAFLLIGSIAYAVLPIHAGLFGFVISAAILSPGYQLFQASNNTALLTSVSEHEKALVSSMVSLTRNSGLLLGSFLSGKVLVLAAGTTQLVNATHLQMMNGVRWSFAVSTLIAVIALGLAFKNEIRVLFFSKLSGKPI